MVYKLETEKDIYEVCARLKSAITENGFGTMQVHNLKETMHNKGVEFEQECRIFEVCNPHQAKKVLEGDMAVSTALPCRISVYTENGKTVLATIRPTLMLSMFNLPELAETAQNVEEVLIKIMQEVISE
jgi:uncharacterized protein (DUF302 family)